MIYLKCFDLFFLDFKQMSLKEDIGDISARLRYINDQMDKLRDDLKTYFELYIRRCEDVDEVGDGIRMAIAKGAAKERSEIIREEVYRLFGVEINAEEEFDEEKDVEESEYEYDEDVNGVFRRFI